LNYFVYLFTVLKVLY